MRHAAENGVPIAPAPSRWCCSGGSCSMRAAAPGLIAAFGYPGLFLSGALLGVLGAISVTRVKQVR